MVKCVTKDATAENKQFYARQVQRTRTENKALQVRILNRFLRQLDEESEINPDILTMERGLEMVNVVAKLELKDQQIEAQKTINNTTNNLFLTVAQRALSELQAIDASSLPKIEYEAAQLVKDIPFDDPFQALEIE